MKYSTFENASDVFLVFTWLIISMDVLLSKIADDKVIQNECNAIMINKLLLCKIILL